MSEGRGGVTKKTEKGGNSFENHISKSFVACVSSRYSTIVLLTYPYDGIKMLIQPPGNKSLLVGNGDSGQSVIKKNKNMVSPTPLRCAQMFSLTT